jgi:phosphate starvation-inducible PhoH-like protein
VKSLRSIAIVDEANTRLLTFPDPALASNLFGISDTHLRWVEERLGVEIHPRGNAVAVRLDHDGRADLALRLLSDLYALLEGGQRIDLACLEEGLRALEASDSLLRIRDESQAVRTPRQVIWPRNSAQANYLQQLDTAELVFALGPAGTGKTFLAVAKAVSLFQQGGVARIILTRPAVEAGERLGFLPGNLQEKVDPYMRPLYDALYHTVGTEKTERMLIQGTLEIAPLAYMRGRTLEEAFIILDEAQNTTREQMKMFLTRLGPGSRAVAAGDPTQVDLLSSQYSGLEQAVRILADVEGVSITRFTHQDVVRHALVRRIVAAYENAASARNAHASQPAEAS